MARTSRGLTQDAFDRLLHVLDGDRDRAGERYELLRRRLVLFFRARGVTCAEEHADHTLTVAATRLEEGEVVQNLDAYMLGIARLIAFEGYRTQMAERAATRELTPAVAPTAEHDDSRQLLFEECLSRLPEDQRDLVLAYYGGADHDRIADRKGLAERHSIPLNALRIRVHRIRRQLERALQIAVEDRG